jgi:hypothetical protein
MRFYGIGSIPILVAMAVTRLRLLLSIANDPAFSPIVVRQVETTNDT